jgi:hypothetical protein
MSDKPMDQEVLEELVVIWVVGVFLLLVALVLRII